MKYNFESIMRHYWRTKMENEQRENESMKGKNDY